MSYNSYLYVCHFHNSITKLWENSTCAQLYVLLEGNVLIILFQLYATKAGCFESNLFWVGQYDPNLHIGRRTNPILISLDKLIPTQITADIIL